MGASDESTQVGGLITVGINQSALPEYPEAGMNYLYGDDRQLAKQLWCSFPIPSSHIRTLI